MTVSVCGDGQGGCYAFWQNYHDRKRVDLMAQHLDAQGNFLWDSSSVLITDEFVSYEYPVPCLSVSDNAGGVICHYIDSTGAKLQRINAEGKFLWGEGKRIFNFVKFPAMVSDGAGGAVVAGSYFVSYDEENGYKYNVGALRINSDGDLMWGEDVVVVTTLAEAQTFFPELYIEGSENLILIWRDRRSGEFDIFAQKINSNGELLWKKEGIQISNSNSRKSILNSGIVPGLNGSTLAIWVDDRDSVACLYGQLIDKSGNPGWPEDKLVSYKCSGSNLKEITDGAGGAIASWYELYPVLGIRIQQISRNGNLGEVLHQTSVAPRKSTGSIKFLHWIVFQILLTHK